jgi:glycosyltransferase involved in cell wall biosynthesis
MRILFAADVLPDPDSGAAGTEWQTIQALRQLGHEVDEVWAGDLGRRIRHGNLHYLLELPRAYRRVIGARCERVDYDVVHANQGHCYLAAIAHQRARRRGVFVCRSHGLDDHMQQVLRPWPKRLGLRTRRGSKALLGGVLDRLLQRHDRLAYRHADGIIVSGSHDADYLRDRMRVEAGRVACIAQAPAAAFVAETAPAMCERRADRILHVGGFAYWKGVHAVAAAVNRLFAASSRGRMTWVCRPEEHAQVRALLDPGVADRVELHGWMSQAQLREVYDDHGVFLCPSLFDGFGKVFLEAMARGLCVIGTRTGGMPDVIRDGESGLLVGFNDAGAIAERIERLWQSPALHAAISAAAAARAREYSWMRVARETEAHYRRLLEQRASGRVADGT